jgi:hypothetical protein
LVWALHSARSAGENRPMPSPDYSHLLRGLLVVGALLVAIAQLGALRPSEVRPLEHVPIELVVLAGR